MLLVGVFVAVTSGRGRVSVDVMPFQCGYVWGVVVVVGVGWWWWWWEGRVGWEDLSVGTQGRTEWRPQCQGFHPLP